MIAVGFAGLPSAGKSTMINFVPTMAATLKVDQKKIEEMSTALDKVESSIWRVVEATRSPMIRAKRGNVSSSRE